MNEHCKKACKHLPHCRLTEEQTKTCKVDQPKDDLILGRTWQEIQKLQRREA